MSREKSVKILYITSTLKKSGPTNQLLSLIKHLNRKIYKPVILTLSPEASDSSMEDFKKHGVILHSLRLSRIKGIFYAKNRLITLINEIKPDIIHTQGIRADSLMASYHRNIPWVLTSHNYPVYDYTMKYGKLKGTLLSTKHLSSIGKCKNVIACSNTIGNQLAAHGIKSITIVNGVETDNTGLINKVRGLEEPVFITVGNLIPRKNTSFIIRAFNLFKESDKKGSLIILGGGSEYNKLKQLAKKNPHIVFKGMVPDVKNYLFFSNYFISASLSEGMPYAVLEALSSGLPVILSDIPSHLEISKECTHCCEIFSINKGIEALVKKLSQAEDTFSKKSKEDAIDVINNVFSAKIMSQNYQNIYRSLISQ
ncbi:MAG: glycosyltransferase [Bacteroidales bacterium]